MPDKHDDPMEALDAIAEVLDRLAVKEIGQQQEIDDLRSRVSMIAQMVVREREEREERESRFGHSGPVITPELKAIEAEAQYLRRQLSSLKMPADRPAPLGAAEQEHSQRGIHILALAIRQASQTRKER